ncbi:MAG: DUF6265 family protein [Fimbriimonadaceae bacterium]
MSLAQSDVLSALNGEWVFVEDQTEGRALEQFTSPMSTQFSFRVEDGQVILVSGHGSGHKDVPIKLDGSETIIAPADSTTTYRYTGSWKEGVFSYRTEFLRGPEKTPGGFLHKEFKPTGDGLIVRVVTDRTTGTGSIGLYQHVENIAMPTPLPATISDVAWISGAWVGSRGTEGSIAFEERWGPATGGAMLAISKTVNRGKMTAFEYLRIIERDGGLIYVAQPNGSPPTEFVLTELTPNRAVFDNPRNAYPKRIVYELSEGKLTATIGFLKGGTPRKFEFSRRKQD